MFRYLKAAFWAAPKLAGLGRLPVNILALSGFGILGFGHAGFWLLGLAFEGTYLYALVSSPRFRNVVDAGEKQLTEGAAERERAALVGKLPADARARLDKLTAQ